MGIMNRFISVIGLINCWITHPVLAALDVDVTSEDSIKSGASTIAYGLVKYYTGNNTGDVAGNLPDPYYWWEAGAMFGALVDYWTFTGDETYNDITFQALRHQAGDTNDFMPDNQTKSEGNDDQGFWALAAMTAAENNFTNPDADEAGWLALAQAVYNEYVERWEDKTCNGGLRWQIFTFNNGYNYKNSVSNGCFFNIASRLARYTGNQTYSDWATKIFEWEQGVGFINSDWAVLDGAGNANDDNCSSINQAQFTYNAGLFMYGAAAMYNHTEDDVWQQRVQGLVERTSISFFQDGVLWEPSCEQTETKCNTDQQAFKGHLIRWMALTAKLVPSVYDTIYKLLESTATAAANQCSGSPSADEYKGPTGTACGFSWLEQSYDGEAGVGEQLNALQAVMAPLISSAPAPFTSDNGGSSEGDVNAGSDASDKIPQPRAITTADRAGAGILTALAVGGLMGGMWFVSYGDT